MISNDDPFQIPIETFISKRKTKQEHKNEKLEEILQNKVFCCECFKEKPDTVSQPSSIASNIKEHKNTTANWYNKKQTNWKSVNNTQRIKIGCTSDINRTAIALLNKISYQNLHKIKSKILQLLNEKTIDVIIPLILKKSYNDINYISIYLDILKSIPEEFNEHLKKYTLELAKEFFFSLPHHVSSFNNNLKDENNLNKYLKCKKELYTKNMAISHLICNEFIEIKPEQYLKYLQSIFKNLDNDIELFDIIIHFTYDFCVINNTKNTINYSSELVNVLCKSESSNYCGKRTNFKLNDLMKLVYD